MSIDVELAVKALLVSDLGVSALIADRIYPYVLPENVSFPAVTYQLVSSVPAETTDGPGLETARIQIDAWSPRRADAVALLIAIDAALSPRLSPGQVGFARLASLPDGSQVLVQGAIPGALRAVYEPDTKLYRRGRDFLVTASAA